MKARLFSIALLAAALLTWPAAARASADATSRALIAQSRVALGTGSLKGVRAIRVDRRISAAGLSGTGTQWLGVAGQRFAEFASLPPLDDADGYDGHVTWNPRKCSTTELRRRCGRLSYAGTVRMPYFEEARRATP